MNLAPGKRLRIAVLTRHFSPRAGGAERYSFALVSQLAQRHDIHVFAQSIEHAHGQPLPGVSYHAISMPFKRPRWVNQLWFAASTWWATRQGRGFDVVHSHENTWHGGVQTVHVLPVKHNLFAGRSGAGVALVWLKVLTSPRLLVYLALERQRYKPQPGRRVVVTSSSLQSLFEAAYPAAASMTRVITPGIDLPTAVPNFGPDNAALLANKHAARQRLGLPAQGQCILFVGHDMRKKGLGALLNALRRLPLPLPLPNRAHAPESALQTAAFVAVVGRLKQAPYFREAAAKAGLADRVFFLGALEDVTPAYRAADCLAHPTLEDTFAMSVLEAMAHGLPVVVSSQRYCGISGLLSHERNALIVQNPRDDADVAATLQRVLHDPALAARLGQQARLFAAAYEWPAVAALQEQLYWEAMAAKA